jgi:murein DD-endopeptidase MepM/ murein hydrolase activator NlpD
MFVRLSIAAFALLLGIGGANADPPPTPMLVPPVSPAFISSPFGPRVLANHPQAGTYHFGVDLPAPPGASIMATAPGQLIRIQKKSPGNSTDRVLRSERQARIADT